MVRTRALETRRRIRDEQDQGFTLIELLVVVIIIGILAAIAVPVYLNQRQKGDDANAQSDLRHLAQSEEVYLAGHGVYTTISTMQADGPITISKKVTLQVVRFNGLSGYCLSARHADSSVTWYWDSGAQGMQARSSSGCPVTTTGTAGDTLVG